MSYQKVMAAKTDDSPTEETLVLIRDRLGNAEKAAQNLSEKLVNYGFKRTKTPYSETARKDDEKPSDISKDNSLKKQGNMVKRLCSMESLVESLRAGMQSLEQENSTTNAQLRKEKTQLQERYSEELIGLQTELDDYKNVKSLLEKQIYKLKKEAKRNVERSNALVGKLEEKDVELNAYQNKLSELSKEVAGERNLKVKSEDKHSQLLLKISELEMAIENEQLNIVRLNEKCETLTEDALMAREEFEKEYEHRLRLENLLSVQTKELDVAHKKLVDLSHESSDLNKKSNELRHKFSEMSEKADQMKLALDSVTSENQRLKESIKMAAIDNQALVAQSKEVLSREQMKIENTLKQKSKMLDSAKEKIEQELDYQRKRTETAEIEVLDLNNKLNECQSKLTEYEFKLKRMEQNFGMEVSRLQSNINTLENIKAELEEQLITFEKEMYEKNTSLAEENKKFQSKVNELAKQCTQLGQKKDELLDKLSWVSMAQKSQEEIEKKFKEMVSNKNLLAYENGVLQSKIEHLQKKADNLTKVQRDYEDSKKHCKDLLTKINTLEEQRVKSDKNTKELSVKVELLSTELKNYKNKLCKGEKDIEQLVSSRDKALEEVEKLVQHVQTSSEKYKEEKNILLSKLMSNKRYRADMSNSLESLISTNDSLQHELQQLQVKMGHKDAELEDLYNFRLDNENVVVILKAELDVLTDKLDSISRSDNDQIESLKHQLNEEKMVTKRLEDERRNLKSEVTELQNDLKESKNENEHLLQDSHHVEDLLKTRSQQDTKRQKEHQKDLLMLKNQISNLKDCTKKKEKINQERKEKFTILSKNLQQLEEDKNLYEEKNKEQACLLERFVAQISDLQTELFKIAETQHETTSKLREKENCIEREKRKRKEMEMKYKALLRKHAELDIRLKKSPLEQVSDVGKSYANDSIQRILREEKIHTKDIIEDFEREMDENNKIFNELSNELEQDFKSRQRKTKLGCS